MIPMVVIHGHSNNLSQIAKIFTKEIHWPAFAIGLLLLAIHSSSQCSIVRELVATKKVTMVRAVFIPLDGRVECP